MLGLNRHTAKTGVALLWFMGHLSGDTMLRAAAPPDGAADGNLSLARTAETVGDRLGGSHASSKLHDTLLRRLDEAAGLGPVKAWVLFKDKDIASEQALRTALDHLRLTYNPRAIQRRLQRRTREGLFDEQDLPVPKGYVEAVAGVVIGVLDTGFRTTPSTILTSHFRSSPSGTS